MKLFEDKPRDHMAPRDNGEHPFGYLVKSGRPQAARVRAFLEGAFSHWPADRQAALARRMRSDSHLSDSFELILHELLRRRRRLTATVEVPKAGTAKRPDFLVAAPWGSFYFEAVLSTEDSPKRVSERKRTGLLLDRLNKMRSPNFFVSVDVRAVGPGQPNAGRIERWLIEGLDRLDPDRSRSRRRLFWKEAGWRIVFRPMPKGPEARGRKDRRAVGMVVGGLQAPATQEAIRAAGRAKATRYGVMDRPYVIAVNVFPWPLEEIDCLDGLFGSASVVDVPGRGLRQIRERDGALGPTWNRRVSAVAFFESLDPWSAGKGKAILVHNPWARHPFPAGQLGLTEGQYVGGDQLRRTKGRSLGRLLGLPAGWPSR